MSSAEPWLFAGAFICPTQSRFDRSLKQYGLTSLFVAKTSVEKSFRLYGDWRICRDELRRRVTASDQCLRQSYAETHLRAFAADLQHHGETCDELERERLHQ
jgi:hypothetical protein